MPFPEKRKAASKAQYQDFFCIFNFKYPIINQSVEREISDTGE